MKLPAPRRGAKRMMEITKNAPRGPPNQAHTGAPAERRGRGPRRGQRVGDSPLAGAWSARCHGAPVRRVAGVPRHGSMQAWVGKRWGSGMQLGQDMVHECAGALAARRGTSQRAGSWQRRAQYSHVDGEEQQAGHQARRETGGRSKERRSGGLGLGSPGETPGARWTGALPVRGGLPAAPPPVCRSGVALCCEPPAASRARAAPHYGGKGLAAVGAKGGVDPGLDGDGDARGCGKGIPQAVRDARGAARGGGGGCRCGCRRHGVGCAARRRAWWCCGCSKQRPQRTQHAWLVGRLHATRPGAGAGRRRKTRPRAPVPRPYTNVTQHLRPAGWRVARQARCEREERSDEAVYGCGSHGKIILEQCD
jgi:hypothetical protein